VDAARLVLDGAVRDPIRLWATVLRSARSSARDGTRPRRSRGYYGDQSRALLAAGVYDVTIA